MRGKSEEERKRIRAETEARRDPNKIRAAHDNSRGKEVGARSLSLSDHDEALSKENFPRVLGQLKEESDRGLAITGGALLEAMLTKLLWLALENRGDSQSLFEDQGGPLSTFRNKILMAHAMGLIDDQTKDEADIIRRIRNRFSHALLPIDLNTPEVCEACKKLTRYAAEYPSDAYLPWRDSSARFVFQMAVTGVTLAVSNKSAEIGSEALTRLWVQFQRDMAALDESGDNDLPDDLPAV